MENLSLEKLRKKLAEIQSEKLKNDYGMDERNKRLKDLKLEDEATPDIWEKVKVANKTKEARAEYQEFKEKNDQLDYEKGVLIGKVKQYQEDIQNEKAKKRAEIEELKKNIEELEKDEKRYVLEASKRKDVMQLMSDSQDSKIYKNAKEENKKLLSQARGKKGAITTKKNKIQEKEDSITELEETLIQLDDLLAELEGKSKNKDNRKQEEEDMWKAYQEGKQAEEARKEKEIDQAFEEKQEKEKIEEEKNQKQTQEEIAMYDKIIENQDSTYILPVQGKRTKTTTVPLQREENLDIQQPKQNEEWLKDISNCKVASIKFYILNGMEPCYEVSFVNEEGELAGIRSYKGYDKIKIATADDVKGCPIKNSEKYYDLGLAEILKELDKEGGEKARYGISIYAKYYNMITLRNQETGNNPNERLDINYDFSGLYKYSNDMEQKSKLKALQKMAKISSKTKNTINTHQKAPNILQRIWKKLTSKQKALPKPEMQKEESIVQEKQNSTKDPNLAILEAKMESVLGKRPFEELVKDVIDEEGFEAEVAIEQAEKELELEREELVKVDETIDAARKWRMDNKIETHEVTKTQPNEDVDKTSKNNEKIKKENQR